MTKSPSAEDKSATRAEYHAPALEKGMDILELLAIDASQLTIKEIARRLDRSMGEVFRIIVVMEQRGWLRRDPESDRYSVSNHVLNVAFRATPNHQLTLVAAPVMYELAVETGQSCHLVVLSGDYGMVVQRQENLGPVGFGMRLGSRINLATSCSGHVLLAFTPQDRIDLIIDALSAGGAEAVEQVKQRLEIVRMQGYEMQPSARTIGVTDVSYPIFGFDGQVKAALTVPFLVMIDGSQRTNLEDTRIALQKAAHRISMALGGTPPNPANPIGAGR